MGVGRKSRKIKSNNNSTSLSSHKHGEKRVGKLVCRSTKTIGSLPRDILVDTLARVASDSFDDLFKAKISCKDLLDAANDDCISQSISLDKFPITAWVRLSDQVLSFLAHCFKKGNPEALFRHGIIEYVKLVNVETGLEYLKKAVEKGHPGATYVYGMVLLSRGDQLSSQEGLDVLNHLKYSKVPGLIILLRERVKSILSAMWINNPVTLVEEVNTRCQERNHNVEFHRRGWSFDENEQVSSCDTCTWYRELVYFCEVMNVKV